MPTAAMNRLPSWFRQELPDEITLQNQRLLRQAGVNTVCVEAKCPNLSGCFQDSRVTFLILGDICTRGCKFCAVKKSQAKSRLFLDGNEPLRVAEAIKKLGIRYAVITSVTRDDLIDGGAQVFSETIRLIRQLNSGIKVEVLVPDFKGDSDALKTVVGARPDCFAHNLETVKSLYPKIRPMADYSLSLRILKEAKQTNPGLITKSSLMLGLGEEEAEVIGAMHDLRESSCDLLTLGQYLAPSGAHYPVQEFISVGQFRSYRKIGMSLGFKNVFSAPLVRSSYQAEEIFKEMKICMT
ncbi:MAG: lipoyl synthase [Candidatus Omnitrophota bacterium]